MSKILIIVDRANGQHIPGEIILQHKHAADDVTVKNLNGVTTGDIDTWLATLTDNYYTKIHTLVNANVTGATGVLSKLQFGVLLEKMLLTVLAALTADAEGTCQANSTSTVAKLAATQTEADDYFNDMFIITAGTTPWTALITDYVLSTLLVTIADSTTAITTTETYRIYSAATLEACMPVYAETYEAPEIFALEYPNANAPLIIEQLGAMPGSPCATATADSVAALSLTDASAFVADAYDDAENQWYVAIRSATLGAGQVIPIVSNTVSVLTLGKAWDPLPTGTIVYEILDRKSIALARYFLQFAFRYLMRDPSLQVNIDTFLEMATSGLGLESDDVHLYQDLDALQEFKDKGQLIMKSIGMGITS